MLMAVAVTATAIVNAATQPNILFLSVDDLKPELGCYGSTQIKTPNIDRLAEGGMVMLNNYCQQALCAPSRMSTFTGLRPDSTKVWDLKTNLREVCPEAVTMQQYFKENGYASAGCGKVMHGSKDEDPPSWSIPFRHDADLSYHKDYAVPADLQYQAKSIHQAFKQLETMGIKGYKPRKDWLKAQDARPATECLDVPDDAYADGAIANYGIELLDGFSKTKQPFFLTLGIHKPHLPFVAPKKYWDLYDREKIDLAPFREQAKGSPDYAYHSWGELRNYSGTPKKGDVTDDQQRELIHAYYACISYVDAQIGRVLDKLKATGLDKNTVVVLWGDHGWHLGDHGLWCKHSNFEQATHAPLIISAPGFPTAEKSKSMTEFVDIYPTLCELAGLPVPETLEGSSLVPILKNPKAKVKDFAMSQYPREHVKLMGYALRTERYRMVAWVDEAVSRTGKFDPSKIDSIELYDYQNDPLETVNLAKNPEYKSIVAELSKKLEGFFKQ